MRANLLLATTVLAAGLSAAAVAQDAPQPPREGMGTGRGMGQNFNGVGGQITAIDGSIITLQTFRGTTAKVKITSSTQFRKDRNSAQLSDFKVGDRVFAMGDQDKSGIWVAQVLGQRTGGAARGSGGPMNGTPPNPEDNGKTYIFGELVKVDGTKLTVRKPDSNEQVIEVDDGTSFRNQRRESVTLADMKTGEFVRGAGGVKAGVFVATELTEGRPRMRPMGRVAPTSPAAQQAPAQSSNGATPSPEENK